MMTFAGSQIIVPLTLLGIEITVNQIGILRIK
jgi:hypothetical protein